MPFMLLIFGFLLVVVLWAFFHYRPRGVRRLTLAVFNGATVVLAAPISVAVAFWLFSNAADIPEKQNLAAYLAFMAGGTAYMGLICVAGLVRNFFIFPLASRQGSPDDHRII
jgi:hypothetical protein